MASRSRTGSRAKFRVRVAQRNRRGLSLSLSLCLSRLVSSRLGFSSLLFLRRMGETRSPISNFRFYSITCCPTLSTRILTLERMAGSMHFWNARYLVCVSTTFVGNSRWLSREYACLRGDVVLRRDFKEIRTFCDNFLEKEMEDCMVQLFVHFCLMI